MQIHNAIALLQDFASFTEETGTDDIGRFAMWLHKKYNGMSSQQKSKADTADVYREIGYLMGRINRYSRHYAKNIFEDLPISTIEEFWFLNVVFHKKNPTKMEIYEATITELATGTQMLRRLIDLGLLSEEQDEADKRVRRVQLTEEGKKVRTEAFHRLGVEARFKMGNVDENNTAQFLDVLRYLDRFHAQHYKETSEKPMEQLLQEHCL